MKRLLIAIILTAVAIPVLGIDFYTCSYLETYRTDLNTTMVSPNIYIKLGKFEGYGFIDRYLENPRFYHGEFMLTFTPFEQRYLDRFSLIYERRWDKFAEDEHSWGLRLKLWEFGN